MPATQTLSYDRFSQAYLKDFDWKVQVGFIRMNDFFLFKGIYFIVYF